MGAIERGERHEVGNNVPSENGSMSDSETIVKGVDGRSGTRGGEGMELWFCHSKIPKPSPPFIRKSYTRSLQNLCLPQSWFLPANGILQNAASS